MKFLAISTLSLVHFASAAYYTGTLTAQSCSTSTDSTADLYITGSTIDSTGSTCMNVAIASGDTTGGKKMSSTLTSTTICGSSNNWYYWSNYVYNPLTGKVTTTLYTNTCPIAAAGVGAVTCTKQIIPDPAITSTPSPTPRSTIAYSMNGVNIFGPWEAGFQAGTFATSGTNCYKYAYCSAGYEVAMCNQNVQLMCPVEYTNTYSLLGSCGGHGTPYHYHQDLSCDYTLHDAFAASATVSSSSTTGYTAGTNTAESGVSYYGIASTVTSSTPVTSSTTSGGKTTYVETLTYTTTAMNNGATTVMYNGYHSPKIGVALDGYVIYGEDEGSKTAPTDLDTCNGHYGITPDSNGNYVYHYHTTQAFPYTLGCYGPAYPWIPLPSGTTTITAATISKVTYSAQATSTLATDKQAQCLALYSCACGRWYGLYATSTTGQSAATQYDWTGSASSGISWGCWDSYCPCGVSSTTTTSCPSGVTTSTDTNKKCVTQRTYTQTGVTSSKCTSTTGGTNKNEDQNGANVSPGDNLPIGAIVGGVVGLVALVATVGIFIKRRTSRPLFGASTELPTKI